MMMVSPNLGSAASTNARHVPEAHAEAIGMATTTSPKNCGVERLPSV